MRGGRDRQVVLLGKRDSGPNVDAATPEVGHQQSAGLSRPQPLKTIHLPTVNNNHAKTIQLSQHCVG